MTSSVSAGGRPAHRLIAFALASVFVFALLNFRLGERLVSYSVLLVLVIAAVPLALTAGLTWALDRRRLTLARWLTFDRWTRGWLDVQRAVKNGDVAKARELFDALPPTAFGDVYGWNLFVNALIAAGRYREALRARRRFGRRLRPARTQSREHYGLALLNAAEALYNLGRWRRARQLMLALEAGGLLDEPLNRAAGHAQLAWIDAHTGQAARALEQLATVDAQALPFDYRAELHFTWAAAYLGAREVAKARTCLATAREHLVRPSSERNLLFLEARCARAEGKLSEAARLCELAANHRYRGQGGEGLLLWGDVCAQLGDSAKAQRAWRQAIERDPESESARSAGERLTRAGEKVA